MTKAAEIIDRLRRVDEGEALLSVYPECRDKPRMQQGHWGFWEKQRQAEAWAADERERLCDLLIAAIDAGKVAAEDLDELDTPPAERPQ